MSTPATSTTSGLPKPATQPALPAPKRMTLDKITKGRIERPYRIVLYGTEGIGKSTFAANAPAPIFLGTEDGTAHLDVERFPKPETWEDVKEAVRVLTQDKHDYQTFALDTLDAAEPLLWEFICKRDGKKSIEDYGYGKGYIAAVDEWRVLLSALERLQTTRRMHVVLVAHALVKPFKNPMGEDYDRYQMKLHDKSAGVIKEWSEEVLFANFETYAHKDEKTKRVRGVSTGARLIYTQRIAAYDAKERHGLPESLPLSWSEFDAAAKAGQVSAPPKLREAIAAGAKELGPDAEKFAAEQIAKAGDDAVKLAQILNRVNAKVAEKAKEN